MKFLFELIFLLNLHIYIYIAKILRRCNEKMAKQIKLIKPMFEFEFYFINTLMT